MTPEEFKAKWKIQPPGSTQPTEDVAGDAATKARAAAASSGRDASTAARRAQSKSAVAPSQADTPQGPLPKELSATVGPQVPVPTPASTFVGPSPDDRPIQPANIAKNIAEATGVGQLAGAAASGVQSAYAAGQALPGQAKSLADRLKEQALAKARAWSVR